MTSKAKRKNRDMLPFGEDRDSGENQEDSAERVSNNDQSLTGPEFVRMEKNIAAFGFFTPTSKRAKGTPPKIIKFTQIIDGNRAEAKVTIAGNTLYGMPTTADQDKYLAFQKILERIKREKGKIENPIAFTSAELLQLLGHTDGGSNFKDVEEWCDVMASTYIKSEGAMWIAGKKKFASDSFVIFQRVRRTGQELEDGTTADKNYIWLSDWYLENINAFYLLPIDFDTYKQLKNNIAKALIPLLQIWLYASREQGIFEKRYDELCQILNIAQYSYPSKIKEKLAPSFNELITQNYLSEWDVSETADKTGYKIVFWHGRKFYQDQTKRLSKANKARHKLASGKSSGGGKQSRKYQLPPGSEEVFDRLLKEFDVAELKALELVRNFALEKIKAQIESFSYRREKVENMSGFIIRAIESDYSLPEGYTELLKKKERNVAEKAREAAIDACPLCDDSGQRNVKSEQDTFYGVMHDCTHDPEVEEQFEDHEFGDSSLFGTN
ncbi:MAG: replication initiator protein A [Pyrinomonadaceae bacterium]